MHILPSYASSTIINGILGVPRCPGRPSFAACRAKVYRATCKKRFSLYFLIILFRLLPYITYYSIYSLTFHTRRSIILIPKEKEAGMITTNDILVDPLTELFHRKELCDNAMSCLPVGRLASSEKNGQLYYEGFVDGQRFTLKRDDPRITAFSDRHLVAATQKAISRKIHSLEREKSNRSYLIQTYSCRPYHVSTSTQARRSLGRWAFRMRGTGQLRLTRKMKTIPKA